jgi:hypothetical protein
LELVEVAELLPCLLLGVDEASFVAEVAELGAELMLVLLVEPRSLL